MLDLYICKGAASRTSQKASLYIYLLTKRDDMSEFPANLKAEDWQILSKKVECNPSNFLKFFTFDLTWSFAPDTFPFNMIRLFISEQSDSILYLPARTFN